MEGGRSGIEVGALCHSIAAHEAVDPNVVKVVLAANGDALYFSRPLTPYGRENGVPAEFFKRIGIYGFRRDVLGRYASLL